MSLPLVVFFRKDGVLDDLLDVEVGSEGRVEIGCGDGGGGLDPTEESRGMTLTAAPWNADAGLPRRLRRRQVAGLHAISRATRGCLTRYRPKPTSCTVLVTRCPTSRQLVGQLTR